MKLAKKKIIIVAFQLIIIFITNLLLIKPNIESYGLATMIYSVFSFFCICAIQKKVITPVTILYITFVLFQSGILIVKGINPNYYNYYMTLFSSNVLNEAAEYTLWSIQAFSITLVGFLNPNDNKNKKIIFSKCKAVNNKDYVYRIAKILFLITAFVVVPLYAVVAHISLTSGLSQFTRSIVASNAIFNLTRAFYMPAFFLLICYGKEKTFTKIATYIFGLTCLFSLLSGNRTDGILWLITYFFYNKKNDKEGIGKQIFLILGLSLLVYIAVYIAQTRMGLVNEFSTLLILSVIEEMGFNFTSICFVMSYIPLITGFEYGGTYLNSILCMFPKSLDIFHLLDLLRTNLPAQWINNINHLTYGDLLDFGVGFSTIAESYMNFANLGMLVSSLYGFLLAKIFRGSWNRNSSWEKYIEMVLFLNFMTFPRRAFNEFLNNVEYSILFLGLLLILFYRKGVILNDNNKR